MIDPHHGWNVSLKPQFIGFVVSLILLVAAYRIVTEHELPDGLLIATIVGFAFLQALTQLIFFLHVGLESKPHWNTITLLFVILVILIIIGGTLWIMYSINYDLMPTM